MTEELMFIFNEIRKTPLEDKLNRTIDSFENMFSLFLEVTDIIDNKLNSLQEQINSLGTRFNRLEQDLTKNQITPICKCWQQQKVSGIITAETAYGKTPA